VTVGALRNAEEGNVVSSPPTKREHPTRGSSKRHLTPRGHVLHSVRRPVHVNPDYASAGQLEDGQADRKRIAVGQTWATRRNRHRGGAERTERSSPCITAPARERRGASKKRKVIAVTVPARKRESMVAVPARRCSLQKSVGERLASNTLARRAPKRATARVNSGLARCDRRR